MRGCGFWTHDCVRALVCSQKLETKETLILLPGYRNLRFPLLAALASHHKQSSDTM